MARPNSTVKGERLKPQRAGLTDTNLLLIITLVVFVVMDYFTGVLAAGVKKELSSEVGFKGIAKKVCIFVLVGIANIVDTQVIHDGAVIRTAVIFFYLANEGLSILENSAIIGLPVPDKLKDMLLQLAEEEHLKDEGDTENSETVEAEASTNPTEADIDDAAEKDSNNQ